MTARPQFGFNFISGLFKFRVVSHLVPFLALLVPDGRVPAAELSHELHSGLCAQLVVYISLLDCP
jgi:hypothetical protein